MARAAIDENGELIAVYNDTVRREDMPPGHEEDAELAGALDEDGRQKGPVVRPPDMDGVARVVDLPDHDRESFVAEANERAGGRAGRIWVESGAIKHVEPSEGEEPETAAEAALAELRKGLVQKSESGGETAITAADIDRAIKRERASRGSRRERARRVERGERLDGEWRPGSE